MQYFILIYFPLWEGGGYFSIAFNITSLSSACLVFQALPLQKRKYETLISRKLCTHERTDVLARIVSESCQLQEIVDVTFFWSFYLHKNSYTCCICKRRESVPGVINYWKVRYLRSRRIGDSYDTKFDGFWTFLDELKIFLLHFRTEKIFFFQFFFAEIVVLGADNRNQKRERRFIKNQAKYDDSCNPGHNFWHRL